MARESAVAEIEDDFDDYRKRAAISKKEKSEKGLFKLPEGSTTFRILKTPGDRERNSPPVWMEYYVHRNVGPKKVGPMRCGLSVIDDSGSCWLCRMVEQLRAQDKVTAAAEMERKKTFAVQIAVLDNDLGGELRGPLLWVMSSGKSNKSCSFKLETIISAPETKHFVDHAKGYNFTMERSGTGLKDTMYGAPERSDETSAVPKAIVAKLKAFADVIQAYDKDAQKRAFYNEAAPEQEEDKPRRRMVEDEEDETPAPKLKKKAAPVEDEDEDPLGPDEDEDETPKAKKKKRVEDEDEDDLEFGEPKQKVKTKAPVEDDEDEDVDEDDSPKSKTKVKVKPVVEDEDVDDDPPEESAKSKKKSRLDVDDEDGDGDVEEDEEDEEKEADEDEDDEPKSKKKSKVVIEEDEDEEVEVKPRTKKR